VIKLSDVEEIRTAERAAIRAGRTEQDLMEHAAAGVAAHLLEHAGFERGLALFLVGPGNNGGDGLLTAAILAEEGWDCRIWMYKRDGVADVPLPVGVIDSMAWVGNTSDLRETIERADLIVDAVFGIGGKTDLPGDVAQAFQWAHEARIERGTPLWAIDVPSGVDADTVRRRIKRFARM